MLNKKTFISLALAAGLTVTLVGCNVVEKQTEEEVLSEQTTSEAINSAEEALDSTNNIVDKSSMTEEEIDKVVIDYYESLSVSLTNLWQDVKENGPEVLDEVTAFLKDVIINIVDFTDNKIAINGVYYSDLSAEGKKIVDGLIGGLVTTVEMINPNLSEDLTEIFGENLANSADETIDSIAQLGSDFLDWAGTEIDGKVEEWRKER